MASETTFLKNLVDPEVMADMIQGKVASKIVVTPFAKIDTTLQGKPGSTITVPFYGYIGDAEDVAEGVAVDAVVLSTGTTETKVKKAVKAVTVTDEAVLSGYGDPEGEAANQLAKAIAAKTDADAMAVITGDGVQFTYDGSAAEISYEGIVDAVDVFAEELNTEKVMFVSPYQVSTLRKDANFISADKYGQGTNVVMTGEIGRIANCRIVPSTKVKLDGTSFKCPIVKITSDEETEAETPAITIYLKRDVNLEYDRHAIAHTTDIVADKHYAVALSDTSKVVLATFKASAAAQKAYKAATAAADGE